MGHWDHAHQSISCLQSHPHRHHTSQNDSYQQDHVFFLFAILMPFTIAQLSRTVSCSGTSESHTISTKLETANGHLFYPNPGGISVILLWVIPSPIGKQPRKSGVSLSASCGLSTSLLCDERYVWSSMNDYGIANRYSIDNGDKGVCGHVSHRTLLLCQCASRLSGRSGFNNQSTPALPRFHFANRTVRAVISV